MSPYARRGRKRIGSLNVDLAVEKLLTIAGTPVLAAPSDGSTLPAGTLFDQLLGVLRHRNGFYALDDALHVRALGEHDDALEHSLTVWNSDELWRAEYDGLADGLFFFAEDLFGGQFAISDRGIVSFDPESGYTDVIAA